MEASISILRNYSKFFFQRKESGVKISLGIPDSQLIAKNIKQKYTANNKNFKISAMVRNNLLNRKIAKVLEKQA